MKLIGFAGCMKAGKTYVAETLIKQCPDVIRLSFASSLKDAFAKEYKIDRKELDDVYSKELYREPMQSFGDFCRAKNEDCFVIDLYNKMEPGKYYAIDDLRRLNELAFVHKLSGLPYLVWAEPAIRKSRGWKPGPTDNHPSETELPSLSYETYRKLGGDIIYNNNRWELQNQLQFVVNKING